MAETLGSLCDKLTIVKLKQWHSTDPTRLSSLRLQERHLSDEIDHYVTGAVNGRIEPDRLIFSANKVYKKEGNELAEITGNIGRVFAKLAEINCELWHQQEKVYSFADVPASEKDIVVRSLAHLNLQRNQCIDSIDRTFQRLVSGSE